MPPPFPKFILKISSIRLAWLAFAGVWGVFTLALSYFYVQAKTYQQRLIEEDALQLSVLASMLVDIEMHEKLVSPDQQGRDLYQRLLAPLVEFHLKHPDIYYLYTMRIDEECKEFFILDTATDPRIVAMGRAKGRTIQASTVMEPYTDTEQNEAALLAMKAGEPFIFDEPYMDSYGTFIPAQAPLLDSNGKCVGYIGLDFDVSSYDHKISGLKHAAWITFLMVVAFSLVIAIISYETHAIGRQRYQSMQRALQGKSDLLAMAAHDLKNPLNAITTLASMMLEKVDARENREAYEQLRLISDSANHMFNLIQDILSAEGLEHKSGEVTKKQVLVDELINATIYFNKTAATKKQIKLDWNTVPEIEIQADEVLLRQALDNLLTNAIKYTPIGGSVRVQVDYNKAGGEIKFSVIDNGQGLSEEEQGLLFEKFKRLSSVPTGGELSTGLGLSIVKMSIEKQGGKVGCVSKLGEGSCFWFTLPL